MVTPKTFRMPALLETLLYSALFLIFFELLTDFIADVYAVGLMGLSIPPQIISVVFLLSPFLLIFFRRVLRGWSLTVLGLLGLVCRVLEPFLATQGQLLVAGIGVGSLLIFLAALIYRNEGEVRDAANLTIGLAVSVGLAILLRVAGNGLDLLTTGMFQILGWALVLVTGGLLVLSGNNLIEKSPVPVVEKEHRNNKGSSVSRFGLGIGAAFVLLYFAFTAPNVISRATGASLALVVSCMCLSLVVFSFLFVTGKLQRGSPVIFLVWNLVFIVALGLTLWLSQVAFPTNPEAYPVYAPGVTIWQTMSLVVALLSFPVIFLDFHLFVHEIQNRHPRPRDLGSGFGLAGLLLLVLIFAQVFTTVYDYVPVVGPLLRDRYWMVFVAAGLILVLPVLFTPGGQFRSLAPLPASITRVVPIIFISTGVISLGFVGVSMFSSIQPPSLNSPLKILTYNIQQGYGPDGQKNYFGQLKVMRQANADIVGLQETDTNRISGGNDDLAGFLANQLGMYVYYGPTSANGTFGIVLLSRFPIEHPKTFYMYSTGEQTAAISAQVTKAGKTYNIMVTHLGNGGPLIQQQQVLQEASKKDNLILMGDFNFYSREEQFQETTALLENAWLQRWPDGSDDQGSTIADQIDHVFISPSLHVSEARYLTAPESDHPALLVAIDD